MSSSKLYYVDVTVTMKTHVSFSDKMNKQQKLHCLMNFKTRANDFETFFISIRNGISIRDARACAHDWWRRRNDDGVNTQWVKMLSICVDDRWKCANDRHLANSSKAICVASQWFKFLFSHFTRFSRIDFGRLFFSYCPVAISFDWMEISTAQKVIRPFLKHRLSSLYSFARIRKVIFCSFVFAAFCAFLLFAVSYFKRRRQLISFISAVLLFFSSFFLNAKTKRRQKKKCRHEHACGIFIANAIHLKRWTINSSNPCKLHCFLCFIRSLGHSFVCAFAHSFTFIYFFFLI